MGKRLFICLFFVISAPALWAEEDSHRKFEINVGASIYRYRKDNGGEFQYGAGPLGFNFSGNFGFARGSGGRKIFGGADIGGRNEHVIVRELPKPLDAISDDASYFGQTTSLRLQYAWGIDAGYFVTPNIKFAGSYDRHSWRHDDLSYGAGTVIPYIKGIQRNFVGHLNFSTDNRHVWAMFDIGVGMAQLDYLYGVESYLSDGDQKTIFSRSGLTVPISMGFGPSFKIDENSGSATPFIKFDYDFSNFSSGPKIKRYMFTFGLKVNTR